MRDILKWKFGAPREGASTPARWPLWVDTKPHPLPPRPPDGSPGSAATWINHSTFLLQTATAAILTDPVFSRCCGPFGRIGPRRVHAPGVALDALPRIDIVFLSHDHYDHCDLQSLRRIARRDSPLAITPLGNGPLLRRAGFAPGRIIERDWWQTHTHRSLRFTLAPSQHWSKRLTSGRNRRLWGGFFLEISGAQKRTLHFAGDTGYHASMFRDIAARLGSPDLALIPIGAYEPRWFMRAQHCNPAEAVQIHRDLASRQSIAMHWGTFQLTEEARDEPARALAAALHEAGIPGENFKVLEPGQSLAV
jgi:L-ascorbate metabolism protein UlaG (beta-lactamase superfamily)